MALIRRHGQLIAFAVVVIAAFFTVGYVARQEAQTNYENQLAGCYRNNPVREAVVLAVETAAHDAAKGRAAYGMAAQKIKGAAHVRPNGSVICKEAIHHP